MLHPTPIRKLPNGTRTCDLAFFTMSITLELKIQGVRKREHPTRIERTRFVREASSPPSVHNASCTAAPPPTKSYWSSPSQAEWNRKGPMVSNNKPPSADWSTLPIKAANQAVNERLRLRLRRQFQ
ncbi:hypothetical protein V1478_013515 [Vespula squamosa]|uniref:Uncharacterized protein n=1 Tax=Vespula squamosa TaxID=30214 RepID=A0ABD2A5E2_VESSQ